MSPRGKAGAKSQPGGGAKAKAKGKGGTKGKSRSTVKPAAREAAAASPPPGSRPRPRGQRLYEMPYSAVAPRLVNPALGLHALVARAGHNAAYDIDVTLLDAPDHRLIRSGVLLAHRVLDGRGEWFLTAPDWQPLLPKDRIEPMGHADLPEELADLIRPLRRRAALGPVAALRCERREFALRDDAGATLGLLRDDKVTVRRGGLTTARYREVTITPVGAGLSEEQTAWLDRALLGVGSTQLSRFPRLLSRLGAPATGPTDIPEAAALDPDVSFQRFVGQLLATRLRQLVEADLAVRGGEAAAAGRLVEHTRRLGTELEGLGLAVEADWLDELRDELGWLLDDADEGADLERLPTRLRRERYLALLDRLVAAARAPRLGAVGAVPARDQLGSLLEASVAAIGAAVVDAEEDAPPAAWEQVVRAVDRALAVTLLAAPLAPEASALLDRRLSRPRALLAQVCRAPLDEAQAVERAAGLEPAAAFAAGRAHEQQLAEVRRTRGAFRHAWAKAERKLAADAGPARVDAG